MDYNNISERLKKTLNSLNARFNDDIIIQYNHGVIDESNFFSSIDFGNQSQEDLINKIFIILHNLASLKDNLKNCLENNGLNKNLVENEVNESLHLQVLIDIINQEKHGYPLTKTNRSGKNPKILNVQEVITIRGGLEPNSGASISSDGLKIIGDGSAQTVVIAFIFDDSNNFLFTLDELVSTCYEKFETIAKMYNCF